MPALVLPPTDDPTFAAMLQRLLPSVRTLLLRLCGQPSDADDLVQETLAKVWRLRATFDATKNAEAWLLQAAFRCFCDHHRRRQRAPVSSRDADLAEAPSAPCAIELRDELQHRLRRLDPLAQALLLGFHRDGRSLRDLAAAHALPLGTVKSLLHRARLRLQTEQR
jgi:RNA polymerase sigma-70 factor (ECF subfamily)